MNIKIIGANCSNGIKLKKNLNKAMKKLNINYEINEIDEKDKSKYGIINTPTLMIDDKVLNHGDVVSERKLASIIKNLCTE